MWCWWKKKVSHETKVKVVLKALSMLKRPVNVPELNEFIVRQFGYDWNDGVIWRILDHELKIVGKVLYDRQNVVIAGHTIVKNAWSITEYGDKEAEGYTVQDLRIN